MPAVHATPDRLTWVRDPRGTSRRTSSAIRPAGIYAAHIRFSPGQRIAPHFHPDDRIVTVLAGTVLFAYGERFDETAMRALPAGSVWTEPAGQPHFAWARDGEVLLQGHRLRPVRRPRRAPGALTRYTGARRPGPTSRRRPT